MRDLIICVILSLLFVASLALAGNAARAEDIQAVVVKVRDGDTLTVRLSGDCLPGLMRQMGVRVRGCDTPEKGDKRPDVRAKAQAARAYTAKALPPGTPILLKDVSWDKYGGRIVADVDGLCAMLIDQGLAKSYDGTGKKPW